MNKSNQIQSHVNKLNELASQSDNDFTQIINGVKLTLGYDPNDHFNLSILGK